MSRPYDVVVFGASGFTGSYVVGYLQQQQASSGLKVAIAGRSRERLAAVNARWHSAYPTLLADVADEASLAAMAQAARVVLNCVGCDRRASAIATDSRGEFRERGSEEIKVDLNA